MRIETRIATAPDVPAIVAHVREVLAEFDVEFGTDATDDELRLLPQSYDAHGGAFWIATRAGDILGTCGVFPIAPATFELRKMYLRPAARGLGVGKRLLGIAIDYARERGGVTLVLDTMEEMSRAISFYEAHGFVRDDAQIRGARCTRGYALRI